MIRWDKIRTPKHILVFIVTWDITRTLVTLPPCCVPLTPVTLPPCCVPPVVHEELYAYLDYRYSTHLPLFHLLHIWLVANTGFTGIYLWAFVNMLQPHYPSTAHQNQNLSNQDTRLRSYNQDTRLRSYNHISIHSSHQSVILFILLRNPFRAA